MGLAGLLLAGLLGVCDETPKERPGPVSLSWREDERPLRSTGWTYSETVENAGGAVLLRDETVQEEVHPHESLGAAWDSHTSAKAWKDHVWDDYLTQPEVLLPVGLAVSAGAISHWDRTLERHWKGVLSARGSYSDIGQYSLIGAVVLVGALLPGEGRNWWDEWWTIGEAYGAASLTVYSMKTGIKRPRPGGQGVGTHSFPSGHSTSAFTAATLIELNSGPALGLPAYGAAAFTAFGRVEEGRHYPSDILAGAAIGTLSASLFDHLHWGSGPQGTGIARPQADFKVGFVDGLHGFDLELSIGF